MGLKLITDAASEPVTTAEAKKQLEIASSITRHDSHVDDLIARARKATERLTRRAWINQTWKLTLSRFPADCIQLPRPPLSSITSFTYIDTDGVSQALVANTDYLVRSNAAPGYVDRYYNTVWPTTHPDEPEAVVITYVAGYGATAASVPEEAKQAILALVTYWFTNRDKADIPQFIKDLLSGLDCGMAMGAYGVTA